MPNRVVCLFRLLAIQVLVVTALHSTETAAVPAATSPSGEAAATGSKDDDSAGKPAPAPDPALDLYWQAAKIFRNGQANELARGRTLLQEAADLENTHAQNYLGYCYLSGSNGFPKEARKAINWFRLAAGRGNAFAKVNLGECYFNGTGVRKDHDQAAEWFKAAVAGDADYSSPAPPPDFSAQPPPKAGESDDTLSGELPVDPADRSRASAHFALGELFTEKNDLKQAQEHYVQAATLGEAGRAGIFQAAIKAAINYAFGKGVPRDMAKANEMLDLSKKLSRRMWSVVAHSLVEKKMFDAFAQADLEEDLSTESEKTQRRIQTAIAGSFADPKSKTYDAREAAKWYELAAEGNEPWAMLSLAFLHAEGKLGPPDPVKAFLWFKQAAEKGNHLLGWANLAICYQNGLGTARDPEKAAAICKAHRDVDIVCYLGSIGKCPNYIVNYDQEFELNQVWAKQMRDPQAQFLLGWRYLYGWGVENDFNKAVSWFEKAAKAGNGDALHETGILDETAADTIRGPAQNELYERAFAAYKAAVDTGNAAAMASLANLYEEGHGTPENEDQAIALYERCLELDPKNQGAHNNLGLLYKRRYLRVLDAHSYLDDISPLKARMLEHLSEADRLGSAHAALNLGCLYLEGKAVERDYQKAYIHLDAAASRGSAEAHWLLGQIHERGVGVPVTCRDAAYHYRLAALGGHVPALTRLCEFYLMGMGVSPDLDRAAFWLGMLIQKGRAGALVPYGDVLLKQHNYAEALKLYRRLTDVSSDWLKGIAYERLSRMYDQGWGVTPDAAKAQRYFNKAFALDNEDALYIRGLELFKAGKKAEAIPLFERAADKDLPAANYTLGYLCLTGDGLPVNHDRGWRLLQKAASDGDIDAEFTLALATLKKIHGAPDLDEAIRQAEAAENGGHPKAKMVREQLEAARAKQSGKDTSSTSARAM